MKNRKLFLKFLVFGFALFALSFSLVYATPTTHIWAPSTDVQPFKKWHITSDFYFPAERDSAGNRPNTVTNLGLTVGVLPFEKVNMEVGFDHKTGYGDLDDYPMYFNAKLGIPEKAFGEHFPALAVGVFDLGTAKDKTNYDVIYGKVAKTLSADKLSLGRISLGYFSGNSKLLLDQNGDKDNHGVFAAWERTMTEISPKLWVCLEYMGTNSSYGTWNVGASWKFSDNVSAILGYDIYNNRNLADTVTMQVDIDF